MRQLEDVRQDIARLNTESTEAKRRLDILEANDKKQDNNISALNSNFEGTKVYITQILSEIRELKSQLFSALTNAQNGGQAERKDWQNLFRDVLKMTMGAIVAYLFVKGV